MTTAIEKVGTKLPISDALKAEIPLLPGGKLIDEPGIYALPYNVYHLDPCVRPSLSSTAVRAAIDQSMWHLWYDHPRLNPDHTPKHKRQFDLGSCAHQLILLDGARLEVIEAPDYRKRKDFDASIVRDEAYMRGDIPVLRHEFDNATAMANAAIRQIAQSANHSHAFRIGQGWAELAVFWLAPNGVWCRALLDWLVRPKGWVDLITGLSMSGESFIPMSDLRSKVTGSLQIYDYKWTGTNSCPDHYRDHASNMGYHIQDAFHSLCLSQVTGVPFDMIRFNICPQEKDPPHAMTVLEFNQQSRADALESVEAVIDAFGRCLMTGVFPGYSLEGVTMDVAPWVRRRSQDAFDAGAWSPELLETTMKAYAPLMIENGK